MTWEWVAIYISSVAALLFYVQYRPVEREGFEELKAELVQMKLDHEHIRKLADETQKLLSQGNLQKSLRPQR